MHSKSQFTTQAPTAPAQPQSQTHALPSFLILKNFPFIYLLGVCLCGHISAIEPMWRAKNNFWESAPSLHHVCPGDQTQVFRLGNKYLYLPSHLPKHLLFAFLYLFVVCLSVCLSILSIQEPDLRKLVSPLWTVIQNVHTASGWQDGYLKQSTVMGETLSCPLQVGSVCISLGKVSTLSIRLLKGPNLRD